MPMTRVRPITNVFSVRRSTNAIVGVRSLPTRSAFDRCAAVVERTNEGASERCPMTGWSSSLNFIGRRR